MNRLLIVLLLIVTSSGINCTAQESFSGTLKGWTGESADIASMGGEPVPIGTVDNSGKFIIPLENDILEKTQKAMEAFNNGPSSGRWSMNTLDKAFSCYSGDSLSVTNGDQVATTMAIFGSYSIVKIDKKKLVGYFMAVSSYEFAEAFATMGKTTPVKGYYLNWYFVKDPATIQGQCKTKSYALNQEDSYTEIKNYELDFKAGWNLVKISADDLYEDGDGKRYFSEWTYAIIPDIPNDVQYLYFPE